MQTWYFAFYSSDGWQPAWWLRFLNPGPFEHVATFSQAANQVVVLDPRESNLAVLVHSHPEGSHKFLPAEVIALDFIIRGAEVIRIDWAVDKTPTMHSLPNFFPGCVTIAKGVLGIMAWVFTPWQFFQWLLDNGGEYYGESRQEDISWSCFGCRLADIPKKNVFRKLRGR